MVFCYGGIGGTTPTSMLESIGTIPVGYRPAVDVVTAPIVARNLGTWSDATFNAAGIRCTNTGDIQIASVISQNNVYFGIDMCWVIP